MSTREEELAVLTAEEARARGRVDLARLHATPEADIERHIAEDADTAAGHADGEVVRRGKWRQVAERLARLDLLRERSGEFRRHVREFRDTFEFRGPPGA